MRTAKGFCFARLVAIFERSPFPSSSASGMACEPWSGPVSSVEVQGRCLLHELGALHLQGEGAQCAAAAAMDAFSSPRVSISKVPGQEDEQADGSSSRR